MNKQNCVLCGKIWSNNKHGDYWGFNYCNDCDLLYDGTRSIAVDCSNDDFNLSFFYEISFDYITIFKWTYKNKLQKKLENSYHFKIDPKDNIKDGFLMLKNFANKYVDNLIFV